MIPIVATLYRNNGSAAPDLSLSLTASVTKLGDRSQGVDDQLTVIQAGELTVELLDEDGSLWTWISSQLAVSNGLLPPWLEIQVAGQLFFLGVVDPSRIVSHEGEASIELGAQDWSTMLSNQYLDTWTRPTPKTVAGRPAVADLTGYSTWIKNLAYGYGLNDVLFAGNPNWVSPGDRMVCQHFPDLVFSVLSVKCPPDQGMVVDVADNHPFPDGTLTQVTLDKSPWDGWSNRPWNAPGGAGLMDTFSRLESATTDQNYYVVMKAVPTNPDPEVYDVYLDTIDGITASDKLHCILGTKGDSWTVLSVNPELKTVTTKENVSGLDVGNRLYFDDATNGELVLQDVRTILKQAASPYSVDLSRLAPATLKASVFGWIPFQSAVGNNDLMSASDLEPNGSGGLRIRSGLALAYDGTPEIGWTVLGSFPNANADWTSQVGSQPPSLMPYEVKTLSPQGRRRNRAYHDFGWTSVDNGPDPVGSDPTKWVDPWAPSMANQVPAQVFYDYLGMRRLTVGNGGQGLTTTPWNGSAWGSGDALAWPSASVLMSLANFPGGPSGALLGLTSSGTLELALFPGLASCTVPEWLKNGVLVPTPQGPFLVGPQGYGRITYTGGVLSLTGAVFPDQVTCFWPNTFVARTSQEACILGRLEVLDGTGGSATETWLYRLKATPDTSSPNASLILSERVADGVPVFVGAQLDPSKPGRVIGHLGGRLFQIDATLPWTIERFTPSGMSALECLEHVAQLLGALVVPTPTGSLAVVSRGVSDAPIPLTVLETKNDAALCWEHFYSLVRVTTQGGDLYYDAQGQDGGNILEIDNHPMLWSLSQAAAMAEAYATVFGHPRKFCTREWFWEDSETLPPWSSLPPYARVTVNGTGPWRLLSISENVEDGSASVTLVED